MREGWRRWSRRFWLAATALASGLLAGACTGAAGDAGMSPDVTTALWLLVALGALSLITAGWRSRVGRRMPSFDDHVARAVECGEIVYERLAADLALASIDGALPDGIKESERILEVLTGQLAAMAATPVASATTLALEDLREEASNLRFALRRIEGSSTPVQTRIPDTRRQLVIFEVALRTFRNEAGCTG